MVSQAATSNNKMWQRCSMKKVRLGLRSPIFSTVARSSRKSSTSFFCRESQEWACAGLKMPQEPLEELCFPSQGAMWQWVKAESQSLKRQTFSSYFMTPEYASTSVTMKSFFSWLYLPSQFLPTGDRCCNNKGNPLPVWFSFTYLWFWAQLLCHPTTGKLPKRPQNSRPLIMTLSQGEASNWQWFHETLSLLLVMKYHYFMYRDLRLPVRESKQQSFDTNNRVLRYLHSCWAQSWVDLVPTPQSRGGSCTFSPVPCQDEMLWKDPEIQI